MFDENQIVEAGRQIGKLQPSTQATQRALDRVRRQLTATAQPHLPPLKRRLFLKIGLSSAAAAAALVVAFFLISHIGPQQSTYAELLRTAENTRNAEWAHFMELDGREVWVSFKPKMRYFEKQEGRVAMIDLSQGLFQEYYPETKTITLRLPPPLPEGIDSANNTMDMVLRKMKSEQNDLDVVKSAEKIDGRETTVYTVTRKPNGDKARIFIDPEKKRWVGGVSFDSKKFEIDYPEKGPEDIYALGVPKDAKVVDQRQDDAKKAAAANKPSFDENLKKLDIDTADLEKAKTIFGEPEKYIGDKVYPKGTPAKDLPAQFQANYTDFSIYFIDRGKKIEEVRCLQPWFAYNGIKIGMTADEVAKVLPPTETIDGGKVDVKTGSVFRNGVKFTSLKDGVLYKNMDLGSIKAGYYPSSAKRVRLWFLDGKLNEIDVTRTPAPSAPASAPSP